MISCWYSRLVWEVISAWVSVDTWLSAFRHVQRSQGADLQLFAIVRSQARGLLQSALLRLHIFVVAHQHPVNVLDLVNGVKNLQTKRRIGDAPVVLGFENEAAVDARTKAIQQMLGQRRAKGRMSTEDCRS